MADFLPEEQAKDYLHSTAQLLFIPYKGRRDIHIAVGFITTRVRKTDEDDWGNLKLLLKYLKGKNHMKFTLLVESLSVIQWWLDASYIINHN